MSNAALESRVPDTASDDFDVIVIGSGIGGLAAAALLTREGRRVLVLERHYRLGGFTHEFQRKGYRWDVGLHYVGDMHRGGTTRGLMDLVTGGRVDWEPMPPDFDVFHYPALDFAVPSDRAEYRRRLVELFPDEAEGIDAYFADVRRASSWFGREAFRWAARGPAAKALRLANRRDRKLGLQTTAERIALRVRDPKLRALLASQWGDYGLPPAQSAFALHALIVQHYLRGGWFPRGGSEALAEAAQQLIEGGGGSCRINHTVQEIVIEDGRAVGVRAHVRKGKGGSDVEFRAPIVISDAGAHTTYCQLLPPDAAPEVAAAVLAARPSTTCVTLYLGLRGNPEEVGLHGENHWHFADFDHDAAAADSGVLRGRPTTAYLSLPSAKDSAATKHTAEIIALCPADAFAPWEGTDWMRRGQEYDDLKTTIAEGLLDLIEKKHPGFRALVDYSELSTPLTVETFTGHRAGAIYGLASTPDRIRKQLVSARSPVPGLFIAGADACSVGIMGALMGGVFAAGEVIGPSGFMKVMSAAKRSAHSSANLATASATTVADHGS